MPIVVACFAGFVLLWCLTMVHTTERSPEVFGRVLDAQTRLPIEGAKLEFIQSPHHAVFTSKDGRFYLKATRNLHLAYIPPEGDWPGRKDSMMMITHPGCKTNWGDWKGDAGDILLQHE